MLPEDDQLCCGATLNDIGVPPGGAFPEYPFNNDDPLTPVMQTGLDFKMRGEGFEPANPFGNGS